MISQARMFMFIVSLTFPICMYGQTHTWIRHASIQGVLNVPEVIQEQDQWCWAAVSTAIIRARGTNIAQCTVAEYTRTHATWHNFGLADCCIDPLQGCNYWNYNWGYSGSIQDILQNWGVSNYGSGSSLSLSMIQDNIDGNKPFVIRWGWSGGGGHFLVGYGYAGSTIYYMNPWPGEGCKIADYGWVVSGDNHTWTHTNILTTPLPVQLARFTATAINQSHVQLNWTTLTEINNYGFEIQKSDTTQRHYQSIPNVFISGYGTTNEPHHYAYVDSSASPDRPDYRLKQIDLDGTIHYSDGVRVSGLTEVMQQVTPTVFSLSQNYPNPFNPSTTIRFHIADDCMASLKVFNTLGQEVSSLVTGMRTAGTYAVQFDASRLAAGVYIYRLEAGTYSASRRLLLIK